jgi:hypothetical protein
MKLILVADSLELNGGCIMFLETLGAFRKYSKLDIEGYVVSKSGNYGRPRLCDDNLAGLIRARVYEQCLTKKSVLLTSGVRLCCIIVMRTRSRSSLQSLISL